MLTLIKFSKILKFFYFLFQLENPISIWFLSCKRAKIPWLIGFFFKRESRNTRAHRSRFIHLHWFRIHIYRSLKIGSFNTCMISWFRWACNMGELGENSLISHHQFPIPIRGRHRGFLYYHGKQGYTDCTNCTISPSGPVKSEHKSTPELRSKTTVSCSGGCLLLSNDNNIGRYSIWNLLTSDSIDLPNCERLNTKVSFCHAILSLSPAEHPNGFLVFLFAYYDHLILYCRVGDKERSEFNYGESLKTQLGREDTEDHFIWYPLLLWWWNIWDCPWDLWRDNDQFRLD